MHKVSRWLGVMIAVAFGLSATAYADGGYSVSIKVDDQDASAAMGSQQAFLVHDDTGLTLYVQSSVKGKLTDFAWILPLPATPTSVAEAPRKLFNLLNDLTTPRFILKKGSSDSNGGGCFGGSESASAGDDGYGNLLENNQADGVTVLKAGLVGDFSYEIVQAESGADLTAWLTQNSYHVSDALSSLADSYVHDGFVFLAAKVRRDASGETSALPALALRFPADTPLLFPMRITALSGEDTVPVVIYVATKGKMPMLANGGYEELIDVKSNACSLKSMTSHLDSSLETYAGHLALQFREPLFLPNPNSQSYEKISYAFWYLNNGTMTRPAAQTNTFTTWNDAALFDSLQGAANYKHDYYEGYANSWNLTLADYGDDVAAIMQPLFGASFDDAYVLMRHYGRLRAADMTRDITFVETKAVLSEDSSYFMNSYVVQWEGNECPHMSDDGCREAPKPVLWLLLGLVAFLPRYRRRA